MPDEFEKRMIDNATNRLQDKIVDIAKGLRRIADELDRLIDRADSPHTEAQWSYRVQDALHYVSWGVANLNLDLLALDAAELDVLIAGAGK